MYKQKSKTPPKGEKTPKCLLKERAYSPVDERRRGKRRLRQGEKLNFRCRKARETRPLCVKAEPELNAQATGNRPIIWYRGRVREQHKSGHFPLQSTISWQRENFEPRRNQCASAILNCGSSVTYDGGSLFTTRRPRARDHKN
ncbi:hypothetical protein TNCV_1773511 [Trichonephila clavipes]|nr:hypothetical protein TNCV_1773511 [Trichonephila clavipes]